MVTRSRWMVQWIALVFGTLLAPALARGQSMPMGGKDGVVWVADGADDALSVVDLATGRLISTLPAGVNPHILSASPDGRIVYVVNAGGHDREPGAHGNGGAAGGAAHVLRANSLWAFEAATGRVLARVGVGQGPTHPVPSPDGRYVYVTNTEGDSVSVVDTRSWAVTATVTGLPEPHDGALTPDGRLLYLATAGNNTVTVVDTGTLRVVKSFAVGNKPRGLVAGGPNGELAYVTNKADGTLTVIDVATGLVKATYYVGGGAHALRVGPDGRNVYVALSKENAVAVVDAETGRVIQRVAVGRTPEQIDLSADGRWLVASNNADGTLTVIDTGKGQAVSTTGVGSGAYGLQVVQAALQSRMPDASSPAVPPAFAQNREGYADITVEQLARLLAAREITLVNVHVPYEGEIPGTDLFVPFQAVEANLDKLPPKDEPVVLYCRSGSMSTVAARTLVSLGYRNVMELDGGFNAWKAAGHTVERKR